VSLESPDERLVDPERFVAPSCTSGHVYGPTPGCGAVSEVADRAPPDRVEFLVCELGGARYAVETGHVESVRPCPPVTRVPRAADVVGGVAAVEGEVVVVVDLRSELGGTGEELLRFERAGQPLGLRIDAAHGVGRYPVGAVSTLAEAGFEGDDRWFKGVLEADSTLPILDNEKLAAAASGR
jgi:chemotaxis signal transduction protein